MWFEKSFGNSGQNSFDISWIEIVDDEDQKLLVTWNRWWGWTEAEINYEEMKNTDDWRLIISESFMKELIEWFEDKKEGSSIEKKERSSIEEKFINYLEKSNLSSLNKFDKDLNRELKTQTNRLTEASRWMWKSIFLDYRPYTEIYNENSNTKIEYKAYDVMNRYKYSMVVILTKDNNIKIEL